MIERFFKGRRGVVIKSLSMAVAVGGLTNCGGTSGQSAANPPASTVPPSTPPSTPPATPPSVPPATGSTVSVSGVISYDRVPFGAPGGGLDYDATTIQPARSVQVELLDESETTLFTTITDQSGQYLFDTVPVNTNVRLRVPARLRSDTGLTYDISVLDNTNGLAPYALFGTLFNSGESNVLRDLTASSGFDGVDDTTTSRPAGPFAILDSAYEVILDIAAVEPNTNFPVLAIWWSVNNRPDQVGGVPNGGIGTSFYTRDDDNSPYIALLGAEGSDTDEYDADVIVHEFGHYIEDNLSRSDSLGGQHSASEALDMRVAFSEGFANALAGIALDDDSVYRDSFDAQQALGISLDLETNFYAPEGWYNEGSVGSVIYDIFDEVDASDDGDTIGAGFGPIYRAMISTDFTANPNFTTIFSFAEALINQPEIDSAALTSLLQNRGINSIVSNASGETNDNGNADILPVYKTMTIDGPLVQLCSINDFGVANKLGTYDFATLNVASSRSVTFNVAFASGDSTVQPNLFIYRGQELIAGVGPANGTDNSFVVSENLDAANYAITLTTPGNQSQPGTDVCYNVFAQGN